MSEQLVVISVGALTAVGLTSAQVCAATRAGLTAYEESDYLLQTADWEPIIAATIPLRPRPTAAAPLGRLKAMARLALEECLAGPVIDPKRTALLLGVRESHRRDRLGDWTGEDLIEELQRSIGSRFHPASRAIAYGNASVFVGLLHARALLREGAIRWCVVGGVDSLLNSSDLGRLESTWRLHREGEAQGLVPGEAAAFLVVTTPAWASGFEIMARIVGIGLDEEPPETSMLSEGHPTGKGLERALAAAVRDAGAREAEVGLRISDLNGERYGALDCMLAVSRFYRTDRDGLPIWHPAESLGETGAAVGALLLLVATDALSRGYAPATTVMCEVSAEGGIRGACLLRAAEGSAEVTRTSAAAHLQRPVLPFIVSQHAEEASFLRETRTTAVWSPIHDLKEFNELDNRLDAHLDGLRIAGEAGWEIVKEQLAWEEAGEVFTGAVLAFESRNPLRVEEVLAVGDQSLELARGVISALGWLSYAHAYPYIRSLLDSENPVRRRIAVGAMAVHRQDPGSVLGELVREAEPVVRERALKAVGELGRYDLLSDCLANVEHEDPACRFWAAWSATLLGDASVLPALWEITTTSEQYAERACAMGLRRLPLPTAQGWIQDLAQRPEHQRLAVKGAGVVGDPAAVPWLLQWMAVPELARIAGEAFTMITGVDIAYEDMEREWPEGFEAGPTEDADDENVEMDADEDLPWPDPQLIEKWWSQNRSRFTPGTRYLMGQPLSPPALVDVLRTGMQRQRAAAALELALLQPAQPLFEVRARGDWQWRMLGI